jgi:hypothetical protein
VPLSKSRFSAGLQCDRQLWWRSHEKDAPELIPDRALQARFDRGHLVGAEARRHVPGGVLIDEPPGAFPRRLAATRRAIDAGAPVIYEAAFSAGQVFAAVDILERTPGGWDLTEVKSSTRVKDEHVPDAALQVHVLRRAGLEVERAYVMHLNPACAYPDLGDLFVRADVTARVEGLLPMIEREIPRQLAMLRGPLPEVAIGPHCSQPHPCPFMGRCWPQFPPGHIHTLYRVGQKWWDLAQRGVERITDLPPDFALRGPAERQARSLRAGRPIFESSLAGALAAFERPLAILDFETVMPAIPVWDGCHPFDAVPVQFSVHIEDGAGGWEHRAWLADGPGDPRAELIGRLEGACAGARTLLAWYAPFERGCLTRVAAARPELADAVAALTARLADAQPLVRDHVYHPDFEGDFGLKRVLPVLVPELSYDGLEIADGEAAQSALEALLFASESFAPAERERVREALTRYCALDTLGVARLIEELQRRARGG